MRQFRPNGLDRARPRRRGAATVEFAIVAPLLFLLVVALFEFSRALLASQVVTSAAREGARRGVVPSAGSADVRAAVTTHLQNSAVSTAGLQVMMSPDPPSSATAGQYVTVRVLLPFESVSVLGTPWFMNGRSIEGTCTMRSEASP